jgi:C1A family cysteine protease
MKTNILSPLLWVLLTASTSWAEPIINVTNLNQTLKQQNATWIAKDNWLTQLPKAEIKRMMGLQQAPPVDVEFLAPQTSVQDTLPSSLDWRNKDGRNWVSPMLNQGNCGSCVAFAAVGVLETQLNISSLFPNLNIRLSPSHLFSCGGGACNYGWTPESAARQLMKTGVADEACMPYTSGATGQDVSCNSGCADISQRTYKISNYTTPTSYMKNIDAIKRALQNGPLMTSLSVYADFMSYAGGVYKHTAGEYLGGHAISIVGYDDATQSFIIRNSWGEDWGEGGFGHVSYTDPSGVGSSTWGFDLPAMGGAVSMLSPRDYTYVTGTTNFQAESTFSSTDSVNFAVYGPGNKSALWASACQGASCATNFDSMKLADGRYEIQAVANNAHGDSLGASTRQFFYIVNKAPTLSLSFKGNGETDLSRPVRDRIEFAITTQSSSVPMSSLEFHFKDSSGKETTRVSNVVVNNMVTGWRTNLVANGTYEIWMVGRLKSNSLDLKTESQHYTVTVRN